MAKARFPILMAALILAAVVYAQDKSTAPKPKKEMSKSGPQTSGTRKPPTSAHARIEDETNPDIHLENCMGRDVQGKGTFTFYAEDQDYYVFFNNPKVFGKEPNWIQVNKGHPQPFDAAPGNHKGKYFVLPLNGVEHNCKRMRNGRGGGDPNDITVP